MAEFTLKEVIAATGATLAKGGAEGFSSITTDTRRIEPGALFVALKGERMNGEDFAAEALTKGAAGVIVSSGFDAEKADAAGAVLCVSDTLAAYQALAHAHRRRFKLPVVAITGSNGKTTTKELTAAALSPLGAILKTEANFNNEIGLPLTLLGLSPEHKAAVVEIGMRGLGQIAALAPIAEPEVAIVTNVGETHIELLGSIENIAKAKAELVQAIKPGGIVILNADDQRVSAMAKKAATGVRVLTYGFGEGADVRGENCVVGTTTGFKAKYQGDSCDFTIPMAGRHNASNALAAIACGLSLGVSMKDIAARLAHLENAKMRFEIKRHGEYNIVNDAYNASPLSMQAAITTLSEIEPGRKIAVLGDMLELGEAAPAAHAKVGRLVAEGGFAALIAYGELGAHIARGAEEASMPKVYRAKSHEEATEILRRLLEPGDTVLVKGSRGMHMEKIIEGL